MSWGSKRTRRLGPATCGCAWRRPRSRAPAARSSLAAVWGFRPARLRRTVALKAPPIAENHAASALLGPRRGVLVTTHLSVWGAFSVASAVLAPEARSRRGLGGADCARGRPLSPKNQDGPNTDSSTSAGKLLTAEKHDNGHRARSAPRTAGQPPCARRGRESARDAAKQGEVRPLNWG